MTTLSKAGTILAGTAAAFVAVMGATGAAEAKGKGKHMHFKIGGGHHHNHHFHRRHFYAGPVIYRDGCGHEKRMWWNTGSFFWKKQYYVCKGWW